MSFLRLNKNKERRRLARIAEPAVTAFYWTGGVCRPLHVRDICEAGAYIQSATDWCAGAVIHLVLEAKARDESSPKATFGVWARIVHAGAGGMGMEFMNMDREQLKQFHQFLKISTEDGVKAQAAGNGGLAENP